MAEKVPYVSFMWSLGTTSFRINSLATEKLLKLLNDFWDIPENKDIAWDASFSQEENPDVITIKNLFYDYMKEAKFVSGNDSVKYKAAREKTSGLVALGLINENRRVTEVGEKLLQVMALGDFSSDNFLGISKDSYVYFKQLLKTSVSFDGKVVRPIIVVLYMLDKLEYLTSEEFMYLVPMCCDKDATHWMIDKIREYRRGSITIREIIQEVFMSMSNYQKALQYLLDEPITEDLICIVGMNRKSGTNGVAKYDKPYYDFYNKMYEVCVNKDYSKLIDTYSSTKQIKPGLYIRNVLFNTVSKKEIRDNPITATNPHPIFNVSNDTEFKKEFFYLMHYAKTSATLHDYFDLNRRFLRLTDLILFEDSQIKLDVIPEAFVKRNIAHIYKYAYEISNNLINESTLEEVIPEIVIDKKQLAEDIGNKYGVSISTLADANDIIKNERIKRFNELIDRKFTDDVLLDLLDKFKSRDDSSIQTLVSDSADVPTIFEYILGVIWYKISERQGDILHFMHLDFDADLLPKTHAGGGMSDIEYMYDETEDYPEHTLMLEATLMNASAQKLNEDEPATRHLGEYILETKREKSYCVFSAPNIPLNLISSFRNKKTYVYFNQVGDKNIEGMKLIPIMTDEIKKIIISGKKYKDVYPILEDAYNADVPIKDWYSSMIASAVG
ncbi:AlwI family type II restriction endonuclease [Lacrimispora sp.]|uniref:AlwI family type II restriction endonuclease n=1 Tax=Lacrimispora sp. TaxID=2719234 RepID=UPI0028644BC9|nr:AlwI family type II restriction endonuclease [Lacrimispora sp.]MDR7810559.1 AlwI family type II restriction endonuclease [Lacrimispora sp.]